MAMMALAQESGGLAARLPIVSSRLLSFVSTGLGADALEGSGPDVLLVAHCPKATSGARGSLRVQDQGGKAAPHAQ